MKPHRRHGRVDSAKQLTLSIATTTERSPICNLSHQTVAGDVRSRASERQKTANTKYEVHGYFGVLSTPNPERSQLARQRRTSILRVPESNAMLRGTPCAPWFNARPLPSASDTASERAPSSPRPASRPDARRVLRVLAVSSCMTAPTADTANPIRQRASSVTRNSTPRSARRSTMKS